MTATRIITIGNFDGVHLGHQALFAQLKEWALSLHAEPMVLSFSGNTKGRRVITDERMKEWYFRQYGLENWQILDFDQWKNVPAEDFVEDFLKHELGVVGLVCGPDFRFGKDQLGNEFTLIGRGIAVKKLENQILDDLRISSSGIRKYLEEGALEQAEKRMGHSFCLMGDVCHGKGLAHRYGLPTVNLTLSEQQLLPPFGVYAAWVEAEGRRYPAAANIGVRPTVEQSETPNLEAHILGAAPELYGREIRVELKSYLRHEMKFESEEQLFLQIQKDGEQSKARLEMLK